MVQLVTSPGVYLIAKTVIDPNVLGEYFDDHEMTTFATDKQTPAGRVLGQAYYGIDNAEDLDLLTEIAGRQCYRAWDKGRGHSEYIGNVLAERHGSVFAHSNVTFLISGVSRSLTHELVRHHVGTNPSQESQRYVTAEGGELEVIGFKAMRAVVPPMILHLRDKILFKDVDEAAYEATKDVPGIDWLIDFAADFEKSLDRYNLWLQRIKDGLPPLMAGTIRKKRALEAARCWLPNACETRLAWTMNMRAARNIFEQRGAEGADLEIRRLAVAMFKSLQPYAPETLQDCEVVTGSDGFEAINVQHSKV